MSDCNASRLVSVTSIAASRTSRPSASSSVRPSRMLATVPKPALGKLQGSCAAKPETEVPDRIPIDKIAARTGTRKHVMNRELSGTPVKTEMAAAWRSARMRATVLKIIKAVREAINADAPHFAKPPHLPAIRRRGSPGRLRCPCPDQLAGPPGQDHCALSGG